MCSFQVYIFQHWYLYINKIHIIDIAFKLGPYFSGTFDDCHSRQMDCLCFFYFPEISHKEIKRHGSHKLYGFIINCFCIMMTVLILFILSSGTSTKPRDRRGSCNLGTTAFHLFFSLIRPTSSWPSCIVWEEYQLNLLCLWFP